MVVIPNGTHQGKTMAGMLEGQVAIITGAGGGLGTGIAHGLSRQGAAIVVAELSQDKGQALEKSVCESGGRALFIQTDVSNKASVEVMVQKAVAEFGRIDILVNNAAIYPSRPWTEITEQEWDQVFAVNIKGYYLCARAVYPHMQKQQRGKIVNVSSITFLLGQWENLMDYVSSKGAIVGFTKSLAREVGKDGITVNCIAPGAFPTAAEKIQPDPEGYNAFVLNSQSVKRRGTPDDIANAVLFFVSDLSDFITGQTLSVDGGWAMV
jgi:NAD(P)-dependent dehydrogenase (short-subunit alcohol dehydrogenase family)